MVAGIWGPFCAYSLLRQQKMRCSCRRAMKRADAVLRESEGRGSDDGEWDPEVAGTLPFLLPPYLSLHVLSILQQLCRKVPHGPAS